MLEVTDIIKHLNLTDIYRTFHSKTKEYILLSAAHENFSNIVHILRHHPSLSKHKEVEITLCNLPDQNGLKQLQKTYKFSEQVTTEWETAQDSLGKHHLRSLD